MIEKHICVLQEKIKDKKSIESKKEKLISYESKLETNINKLKKDCAFFENYDNCPTCKQTIDSKFKQEQIESSTSKVTLQKNGLQELNTEYAKMQTRLTEILGVSKHITEHNNEIVKHNSTLTAINSYVAKLNKEIVELGNKKQNLTEENDKLKEIKAELSVLLQIGRAHV